MKIVEKYFTNYSAPFQSVFICAIITRGGTGAAGGDDCLGRPRAVQHTEEDV